MCQENQTSENCEFDFSSKDFCDYKYAIECSYEWTQILVFFYENPSQNLLEKIIICQESTGSPREPINANSDPLDYCEFKKKIECNICWFEYLVEKYKKDTCPCDVLLGIIECLDSQQQNESPVGRKPFPAIKLSIRIFCKLVKSKLGYSGINKSCAEINTQGKAYAWDVSKVVGHFETEIKKSSRAEKNSQPFTYEKEADKSSTPARAPTGSEIFENIDRVRENNQEPKNLKKHAPK